jgi:hypothetical protein
VIALSTRLMAQTNTNKKVKWLIVRDDVMSSSALANASYWLSALWWAKLIAAGLVAVGVVIEFSGDWISRPFEKTVEDARETEIARLSAAAESARAEIAKAQSDAAKANERTEELRAENLRLERQLNPRVINDEQAKEIVENIKPFAGTQYEVIADPAAEYGFVDKLMTLLNKAQWRWKAYSVQPITLPPADEWASDVAKETGGVQIRIRASEMATLDEAAKALAFALTRIAKPPALPGRPKAVERFRE